MLYAPIATLDVKSGSKQLGSKKKTMVEGQQEQPGRYCPICETWMDHEICPTDQVPTIKRETLEEHSDTLAEGTVLGGRYSVSKLIGMGGMGAVYLATQTNMNRKVALKTMKKEFMSNERLLKRFYREARAAAALDHPNLVKVYDFGLDQARGLPFIAMEYLEGQSLEEMIADGVKLPESRACRILSIVSRALTDAHSKGVVHRDLKPDNVYVQSLSDGTDHIKVLDFGIAKIRHPDGTPTERLTGTGMALGTPYYMSPEQAMGKTADFRSDLYAIGCILYQLVSGDVPFDADQPMAILLKQLKEPPPELPEKLVNDKPPSEQLKVLYARLMEKLPDDRPNNTLTVAETFHNCALTAEGRVAVTDEFSFGSKTLGASAEHRASEPGLATLLGKTTGEEATLEFDAITGTVRQPSDHITGGTDIVQAATRGRSKMLFLFGALAAAGLVFGFLAISKSSTAPQERVAKASSKPDAKPLIAKVNSTPPKAIVYRNGLQVGVTPVQLSMAEQELPLKLRIIHDGYQPQEITLKSDALQHDVSLVKISKRKAVTKTSPKGEAKKAKKAKKKVTPVRPAKKTTATAKPVKPKKKKARRSRPAKSTLKKTKPSRKRLKLRKRLPKKIKPSKKQLEQAPKIKKAKKRRNEPEAW